MSKSLALLALALAVFVAACGSDDAEETTTSAPTQTTTTTAETTTSTAETTTTEAQTTTTGAAGGEVSIVNFSFRPADISVAVGTTVSWTNGDSVSHTTSSDDDAWDSGTLSSGDSFQFVFDTPGTYLYHCNIHPQMKATITVEG